MAYPTERGVQPVVDRQDAPDWPLFAIRVLALAAPWLLRRMRTVSIPIRLALFFGRILPVAAWLLRRTDHFRPAAQPLRVKQRGG
jgi:hypothetical protein